MNILITSASRKVSLVNDFKKAISQEGGGVVVAVDINTNSAALYFANYYYLVPETTSPEFTGVLNRICKTHSIDAIIPTRDEELLFFSENREEFPFVMVPSTETIRICQDKKAFIEFCGKNGFHTPEQSPYYPLFVKPRFGKGGAGATKVSSGRELDIVLEKYGDVVIQKFIDSEEYTIDLFADFESRVISAIPRQRVVVFGGESFVTTTVMNKQLIDESCRLAIKLKLIGHNTIQAFLDDGKVKFIEVNPRYGGAAKMGFFAGAFTPIFLIRLLNGESVDSMLYDFNSDITMLRYTNDVFIKDGVPQ